MAVGTAVTTSGKHITFSGSWNGSHWTIHPTVDPPSRGSWRDLNGVSCLSDTACVAVGEYGTSATYTTAGLIERWNGHRWRLQYTTHPVRGTYVALESVSCASGSSCVAVGSQTPTEDGHPIARIWNGTRWRSGEVPYSEEAAYLQRVSCPSPTLCIAVGNSNTSRYAAAVSEQWDGQRFTEIPVALPADTGGSDFYGVSCGSATHCLALGYYGAVDADTPMLEAWDGSHWSVAQTGAPGEWNGLACRPAFCVLVGAAGKQTLVGAYHWEPGS